jgi:hypothetical protein
VLELLSNNVMEPMLYGRSVGVSEVALMIAAGFWTFLWGPMGLVLSTPLTVCLVVLGEYVTRLRFLAVLLGDRPALDPDVRIYQRLAAGDQDEAMDIVADYLKENPSEQVYDGLLLPALLHVRRAQEHDELTEDDERFILDATREMLDDLGDRDLERFESEGEAVPDIVEAMAFRDVRNRVRILGVPARDELDVRGLEMLRNLLSPAKWEVEVAPVTMLAGELLAHIEERRPAVLCIGSLPPGGRAHTRYLCKRLRGRFPGLKLIVGRWGLQGNVPENQEQLRAAGADSVDTTLVQTQTQLGAWLPVLQEQGEATTGVTAKRRKEKV